MTFVPFGLLSIRSLSQLTYASLGVSLVPLVLGIVTSEWRLFAAGLVATGIATWLDRWRAVRVTEARYGRLISMWHDDVDAVQDGRPRPDLSRLDVPVDLTADMPRQR